MAELTVAEWAKQEGISPQAAYKRIKSGKVTLNPNGRIDVDQAAKQWAENKDVFQQDRGAKSTGRKRAPTEEDPKSLNSARKYREWIRVEKEQLELKKLKGELLPTEEVERAWATMVSSARSRLLLLPDKVATRVSVLTDVLEIRNMLDEAIREALSALAGEGE